MHALYPLVLSRLARPVVKVSICNFRTLPAGTNYHVALAALSTHTTTLPARSPATRFFNVKGTRRPARLPALGRMPAGCCESVGARDT